jgi:hypothetical protein
MYMSGANAKRNLRCCWSRNFIVAVSLSPEPEIDTITPEP